MNKIAEQTLITLIDQLRDTHLLSKEEWMFLIENRTRDVNEYNRRISIFTGTRSQAPTLWT